MKCSRCESETNINWGNASKILCESCSSKTRDDNPTTSSDQTTDSNHHIDGMIPIEEYATRTGMSTKFIIEMIKDGSSTGRMINDTWYIKDDLINQVTTKQTFKGKIQLLFRSKPIALTLAISTLTFILGVLVWNYYAEYKYTNNSIPDGAFLLRQVGDQDSKYYEWYGYTTTGTYAIEFSDVQRPIIIKYIYGYRPSADFNERVKWNSNFKRHAYKITSNGAYLLTGNLKWRFIDWSPIGGSIIDLQNIYPDKTDFVKALIPFMSPALKQGKWKHYPPDIFTTRPAIPFFTPIWLTIILLSITLLASAIEKHTPKPKPTTPKNKKISKSLQKKRKKLGYDTDC